MFITYTHTHTCTHSSLDLIPLTSRNDLISQTKITVPSADRHPQLSVVQAEKHSEVLLPEKP